MRFINTLLPKAYSLGKSTKLAKFGKGGIKVENGHRQKQPEFGMVEPDELYLEGRRLSRSKKSRDYSVDMGIGANKGAKTVNDNMKKCEQILNMLCSHKFSDPFLDPVDYQALELWDYPTVVKEPMDLSTVRKKLKNRQYKDGAQFAADVRRIWQNSFLYNQKYSGIYNMTLEMSDYFEKLNKELNDAASAGDDYVGIPRKSRDSAHKPKDLASKLAASKNGPTAKSPGDKPLTLDEKMALSDMIKSTGEITR